MKRRNRLVYIILFIYFIIFSDLASAQGFIGETERQIRNDFIENPSAIFHVNYVEGRKALSVVDNEVQMNFLFDANGACCNSYMYVFNNDALIESVLQKLNQTCEIIKNGKIWKTNEKAYVNYSYSNKMKSYCFGFYTEKLFKKIINKK